jgi:hypothetical protein
MGTCTKIVSVRNSIFPSSSAEAIETGPGILLLELLGVGELVLADEVEELGLWTPPPP